MRTYLRKFSALAIKLQKPAQSYHFFLHIIMCVPKFFINTLICIILSLLCFMYFLYILFVVFIAGKRLATAIPTCSFGGAIRSSPDIPAVVRLISFLAILTEIEISLLFSLPHTTVLFLYLHFRISGNNVFDIVFFQSARNMQSGTRFLVNIRFP